MIIAILGTGAVARTLAEKLASQGHIVHAGTRNVKDTMAHSGASNFADWLSRNNTVELKIIIDVSNPLDLSHGFPPTLLDGLHNTNSLGESLQHLLPASKVVKTLNTMWCGLMLAPGLIEGGKHVNFICGNDTDAKAFVIQFLAKFGWSKESILDLGDITNARGTEAYLLLWTRIYGATQNGAFNLQIAK
jgi:8-hydroxy-5-deazaflavin:NADPH oxidoreductase